MLDKEVVLVGCMTWMLLPNAPDDALVDDRYDEVEVTGGLVFCRGGGERGEGDAGMEDGRVRVLRFPECKGFAPKARTDGSVDVTDFAAELGLE